MVANISKEGEFPTDTLEPNQPTSTDPVAAQAPQPEEQKMEIDTTQNAQILPGTQEVPVEVS